MNMSMKVNIVHYNMQIYSLFLGKPLDMKMRA